MDVTVGVILMLSCNIILICSVWRQIANNVNIKIPITYNARLVTVKTSLTHNDMHPNKASILLSWVQRCTAAGWNCSYKRILNCRILWILIENQQICAQRANKQTIGVVCCVVVRAGNEPSQRWKFHNQKEGPYLRFFWMKMSTRASWRFVASST